MAAAACAAFTVAARFGVSAGAYYAALTVKCAMPTLCGCSTKISGLRNSRTWWERCAAKILSVMPYCTRMAHPAGWPTS